MDNLWHITLTNQHNATYTCALQNIADASALKCLEIKWDPSGAFVAIVEPKPEGIYIKEVAVRGERLGFPKATGMLLPAALKPGDTWQVSTQKKSRLARILFRMDVTVVEAEEQIVLSVNIAVNARAPLKIKQMNETVEAVVSINPADFQIERVQLPNGDIYEKQA